MRLAAGFRPGPLGKLTALPKHRSSIKGKDEEAEGRAMEGREEREMRRGEKQ